VALLALWRTKLRTFGWRVMIVALSLLVVDFFQYFVVFTIRQYINIEFDYLAYNPIIDFVLQILLGFGMVIILLEQVLTDARIANERLKKAHEKLEELAHVDPLTTALNRHAFHGYLKRRGSEAEPVSGCVGFFDIDDFKAVNDLYGHKAGDLVIRLVVRAIRDLIFRWGGDEFFVIMVGLDADVASSRMTRMDEMLSGVRVDGVGHPLTIRVSNAFEDFADLSDLESTINRADAGMYRQKQIRKRMLATSRVTIPAMAPEREVLVGK
jgi:diguanylate cyclase (GGDEF)-like protein